MIVNNCSFFSFMVKLYKHQKEAVSKLKNGAILCGGVGSGKSITALAYFNQIRNGRDLYIITTARKRDDKEWEIELSQFSMSAVIDSWNNIKKYIDVANAFFIFDEQRVVGSGAWVKSFIKITKSNDWILLSATPGDTWSDYIPVFIANGFYKNKSEFITRHVVYSRFSKYPKIDRYLDQAHLERLRRSILVDMDYSRPAIRHPIDVNVVYDVTAYRDVMRNRFNYIKNRPIKNVSELCVELRRVVNSDPSRIEAIRNLVKLHKRAIIFYNYNYELDILLNADFGDCEVRSWNGHVHEALPDSEEFVYLVQYTAGAEGWNCTSTNVVIFYSLNYSYKIMEQACGRIDRVNTPYKDLYYYYIKSKAPIDLAVGRALKQKKKFNERSWLNGK